MGWLGSAEHHFNTDGQTKCGDCGLYYPEGWASHGRTCSAYVSPEEEDDE